MHYCRRCEQKMVCVLHTVEMTKKKKRQPSFFLALFSNADTSCQAILKLPVMMVHLYIYTLVLHSVSTRQYTWAFKQSEQIAKTLSSSSLLNHRWADGTLRHHLLLSSWCRAWEVTFECISVRMCTVWGTSVIPWWLWGRAISVLLPLGQNNKHAVSLFSTWYSWHYKPIKKPSDLNWGNRKLYTQIAQLVDWAAGTRREDEWHLNSSIKSKISLDTLTTDVLEKT